MDKKEKLTKEQLIEKINNERQTFKLVQEKSEQMHQIEMDSMRHLCDMVLARVVESFGTPRGDELTLDILAPSNPEGKFWCVKVEQPDKNTYRLVAKLFDIPVLGETKKQKHETIARKKQEESKHED